MVTEYTTICEIAGPLILLDRVDHATYEEPHRYAAGVSTVVVNGQVAVDGGDHTGALPGRVIRRAS